jgi:hypothetical protein
MMVAQEILARMHRQVWGDTPCALSLTECRVLLDENDQLREALQSIVDCYHVGESPEAFVRQVAGFMEDARALLPKRAG